MGERTELKAETLLGLRQSLLRQTGTRKLGAGETLDVLALIDAELQRRSDSAEGGGAEKKAILEWLQHRRVWGCVEKGKPDCDCYVCKGFYRAIAFIERGGNYRNIVTNDTSTPPPLTDSQREACKAELENIVNAKRFDRSVFADDREFADWAQSRARHTLNKLANGGAEK